MTKKKKLRKNAPSTRRKKLTQEQWDALVKNGPRPPKPQSSSGALSSIDMRQFKLAPKAYEGGAPGLRSQHKR
ncbi:hypothetical protein [Rhizobium sp. ICMP 5592]|uniref:hypothetical protein n=1 Tax=Rhizobium sp. ICMP 5592 TaxID=2292445 RepID=UPI001297375D|nr:hypothetical protein [Rhizobium sp. ICMP 5592]